MTGWGSNSVIGDVRSMSGLPESGPSKLWAAVFQKIFGGATILDLLIAIRRVFVDPPPELSGADAHVRGECDQIFKERTTALLVVLKTGVGRSEFHDLRLLSKFSVDEGQRPSHRSRCDHQDDRRHEQQSQHTE